MQLLRQSTNRSRPEASAHELLDATPPVIWFMRRRMRSCHTGLTMTQFRALVRIHTQPTVCLSAVADHLGAPLPTVSRIVSGLVARGMIARTGCPDDRRQASLAITDKGRSVLYGVWADTQAAIAEKIEGWTPEQHATVSQALQLLVKTFGSIGLPDDLSSAGEVPAADGGPRLAPVPSSIT